MRLALPEMRFRREGRVDGVGASGFEVGLALGVVCCTEEFDAAVVGDELVRLFHVRRFRLDLIQRFQCAVVILGRHVYFQQESVSLIVATRVGVLLEVPFNSDHGVIKWIEGQFVCELRVAE